MALVRIAGGEAPCGPSFTCPGVWIDDEDPEYAVVVGYGIEPAPIPLAPGERAVRVRRALLREMLTYEVSHGS